MLLYVLTATSVSVQVQVSLDAVNWTGGKLATMSAIGRKLLSIETGLGAPFLRLKLIVNGTGKAILDGQVHLSGQ